MPVNIRAQFGKKEKSRNGLEALVDDLNEKPDQDVYIVARVQCAKTEINHLDGDTATAKVTLVHIEPALSAKDEDTLKKMLGRAYKARTGQSIDTPLPGMPGEQPLPDGEDEDADEGERVA